MHYSFRSYLIGRKRACRLTDRGIEMDDCAKMDNGAKGTEFVPYAEIRGLNLRYNAFVPGAGSYRCVITTDRRTVVIPSSKPDSDQPDADLQTYRDFVADLHQRLEPAEDRIRFTRGSTGLYFTSIILSALLLALVGFGLYLVFHNGTTLHMRSIVKFVAVGYFLLACLFPMIQRGKTALYQPAEIPTDLLPAAEPAPVAVAS